MKELVDMIPDGLGDFGSQPQPLPSSNAKRSDISTGNWPQAPNGVRLYSAVEVKSYEYVFPVQLPRSSEICQLILRYRSLIKSLSISGSVAVSGYGQSGKASAGYLDKESVSKHTVTYAELILITVFALSV